MLKRSGLTELILAFSVSLASGCASHEASPPRSAKLKVETVFASATASSDVLVSRILEQVPGARMGTIVRGTVTDAGDPANPLIKVGDVLYVVATEVSVGPGGEASFAAADDENAEYDVGGQKVLVVHGGLHPSQ
jgi:hypothetical protein